MITVTYTWKTNTINCLFNNKPGNLLKFARDEDFREWQLRNKKHILIHNVTTI